MAIPQIRSVGSTSGTVNNLSRLNLVIGETVTLSDTNAANTGLPHSWAIVDRPVGSASSLTTPGAPTSTFVPDTTGTYFIRCTVNGTDIREVMLAVALTRTGARIPAFTEKTQYDAGSNTKGWHEALTVFMRQTDSLLGTFLRETGGPTVLTMGAVADGKVLARSGSTIVGVAGGHTIKSQGGSALPTRASLNFTGGLKAVDDSGGDEQEISLANSIVRTVYSGVGRDDNDDTVAKVVGAFAFNPADYVLDGTTRQIRFRVVAAAGNTTVIASIKLRNVTDSVDVVTLTLNGVGATATQKVESNLLTVPADLPNSEKVYEVHIFVDTPGGSNICIVYSAGLVVTNVVA